MARFSATGQVFHNANGYSARVRVGSGPNDRPVFALLARDDNEAEKRAALLADLARRLRPLVSPAEVSFLLTEAGKARTDKALATVIEAVEAIESGTTTTAANALTPTFAAFAADWTSGKLRQAFPDHVRAKDSKRDVQVLRDFINPVMGTVHLADVTLAHAERVMACLPSSLAPRSRKIVAQCIRKVLAYAVYPGRHIETHPIPKEWMPKIPKSANRAKACLHPSEDAALMRCTEIPIERRLAYGILAREGLRASELEGLRWNALDLEHGRVRLDKNKTFDGRAWALSPDVVRTLAWWKKRTGAEDTDRVLLLDLADGAWWLRGDEDWTPEDKSKRRGDLRTAGVTRAELFERSATRQPIRLHDLRATFCTIALATGRSETWCCDRTGHRSSQMLAAYTRQARTWAELDLGALGALDELLPEVSTANAPSDAPGGDEGHHEGTPSPPSPAADWAAIGQRVEPPSRFELETYGLRKGGALSRSHGDSKNKALRETTGPEIERVKSPPAQFLPNGDPLERALLLAAEAGQWAIVAALSKELEARRLEGSNVHPLASPKRRGK